MIPLAALGYKRRLHRILKPGRRGAILVPLDDTLLAGPTLGLDRPNAKLERILAAAPDAIVGFKGLLAQNIELLDETPFILNLTASTTLGQHTRKVLIGSTIEALRLGADGVAVHVNISSVYETEMLKILGSVSHECENYGIPLLAHMYLRGESDGKDNNYLRLKTGNRRQYAGRVAHACRVAVDLGAAIIKTNFTGDAESFSTVTNACTGVPVLVAGGPPIKIKNLLEVAHLALEGGAAGICFGRNIFSRPDPERYLKALKVIVHEKRSLSAALNVFNEK